MPTGHPNAVRPDSPDEIARAYALIEAELAKIPTELVGRVTADVPTAVSLALGALPGIQGLVPTLQELLKKPPLEEIERLRARALGLLYTHLRHVPPTAKQLEADLEEARVLREQLLSVADAHVRYGAMNAAAVARIRDGAGHLDRANDLIALGALFRAAWPAIGGATLVTPTQLDRASILGTQLVAQLGEKTIGVGPAGAGKTWSDQRNRAFRLFMFDYEEIRCAVRYVRHHEGDADTIVPSLHTTRKSLRAEDEDTVTTGTDTGATDTDSSES